jgi:hypothetical protein
MPDLRRAYLSLEFSQLTAQDEVLFRIQDVLGGAISISASRQASTLKVHGKPAELALNRIRKHLVIKRHYANVVLDMVRKPVNMESAKAYLKAQRQQKSLPMPNFPPRKWLAGYFDGDGSFQIRVSPRSGSAQIVASIVSSAYDSEGIEILQKAFGGSMRQWSGQSGTGLVVWTMSMPPSKAIEFIGYFQKHLITKREQALFILGCAAMGHSQDGERIKAAMKQLKAQPHRLNVPRSDVAGLLATVSPMRTTPGPNYRQRSMRQSDPVSI